jgi:hypothetical protein
VDVEDVDSKEERFAVKMNGLRREEGTRTELAQFGSQIN